MTTTPAADTRWRELATHLATHLGVAPEERVSIFINDVTALPAAHALIGEALRSGALVQTVYQPEFADDLQLLHSTIGQISNPAAVERAAMEWSTVHISFRSMLWPNMPASTALTDMPTRLAAIRQAKGAISSLRWQTTRWAVVRIPTAEWAEQIGVEPAVLLNEFFAGALDDWQAVRRRCRSLSEAIDDGSTVTITAPDTDLRIGIAGRTAALFAGEANIPDGEIATAPVDDQVDGYITFPGMTVFGGQFFDNLFLRFEAGRVVEVRADRGTDIAQALVDTDDGSCCVGELGIGVSSAMQQWTGDLFFDEKILGTVHLALGRAYPQCGGVNQSTLHWDIVKDLRATAPNGAGSLAVDGVPVIESGRVAWPGLTAYPGNPVGDNP